MLNGGHAQAAPAPADGLASRVRVGATVGKSFPGYGYHRGTIVEVGADDVVVHWETHEHSKLSLKEALRRVIAAPARTERPPATPAAAQALDPATAAIREAYAREQAAAKSRENVETPKPETEADDESDSDDESLNAMRRSARERLDAATFTTGSKVEVTSPGGVCCTSGVVVHDNHHGVSVRFKVEDGDGAVVVVDPSAVEIVEYALPGVEEDVEVPRPAVEPPKDDAILTATVTPDDAANSSILKMSGAPASKRRRVFDDRLNVVPLGPLPTERPLGPSAHEVWFGRASPE